MRIVAAIAAVSIITAATSHAAPTDARATLLEEAPLPLAPLHMKTERDADRVEAAALVLSARVSQQRGDGSQALRAYQRAWRIDPRNTPIVVDIATIADKRRRPDVVGRYLFELRETDYVDPAILQRTRLHYINRGDLAGVARCYRMTLAQNDDETAEHNLPLWLALGRIEMQLAAHAATGEASGATNSVAAPGATGSAAALGATGSASAKRDNASTSFDSTNALAVSQRPNHAREAARSFAQIWPALRRPDSLALSPAELQRIIGDRERTFRMIAESFLAAGMLAEASQAIEAAYEGKPDAPAKAALLAELEFARGDRAAAAKQLDRYFASSMGEGPAPLELLKKLHADRRDSAGLITRLQSILAQHPADAPTQHALATALRDAKRLDEAQPHFAALYAAQPSEQTLRELAQVCQQRGDADAWLSTIGKRFDGQGLPENPALNDLWIFAAAEPPFAAKVVQQSQADATSLPAESPTGRLAAAALVARSANDVSRADPLFERVLARPPGGAARRFTVYLAWGQGLVATSHFKQAATVYERAASDTAIQEFRPAFLGALATAQLGVGEHDRAIASIQAAVALRSDSAPFAARLALIERQAGRLVEAQRDYQNMIARFDRPSADDATRGIIREARRALADLAAGDGDMESAAEQLELILDEYPADHQAANDLGYLWADQNRHLRRAFVLTSRAVAAEPENLSYRDSLGWTLFRLGEFDRAIIELELATAATSGDPPSTAAVAETAVSPVSPVSPVALDHLGDARLAAGQRDAAIHAWRQALQQLNAQPNATNAAPSEKKLAASLQHKIEQHSSKLQRSK